MGVKFGVEEWVGVRGEVRVRGRGKSNDRQFHRT